MAAIGAVLLCAMPVSAQRRVVRPEGAPADRPYSPGVLVGQTLYISGQLGLPGTGATPAAMDAQARQAMDGIGAVLKASGLGYQHLVKCHVYLANMDDYAAMNAAYGSYFTDRVPARTTVQAAGLPGGAGVQIACIAFADLARISVVRPPSGSLPAPLGPYSPAVWAGDTLYVSGMGGQDPATKTVGESVEAQTTQTIANITTTLKAAGLGLSDVAWAQGYATRLAEAPALEATLAKAVTAPRGMLVLPRLPGPIRAELTFIATRSAGRVDFDAKGPGGTGRGTRRGSAAYVDALSSPGDDVETATKQTFARLGELLQQAQMGWRDVALVTVYLSDIADMPKMNAVFAETFPKDPPARITIQVQPQANERVRIGVIAAQ
jgi:2-iminobutanoate/2-iminopropanoate deaminase